jgi:hypothetical protein
MYAAPRRAIIVMRDVTTGVTMQDTIRVSIAGRRHRVIIVTHAASRRVMTAVTTVTVARRGIVITMTVRRSARSTAATTRAIGVTLIVTNRAKIRDMIRVTIGVARRHATIVMPAATIVARRQEIQEIQETIVIAATIRATSPATSRAPHPNIGARCCVSMSATPAASSRSSANSAARRRGRRRIATAIPTPGGIAVSVLSHPSGARLSPLILRSDHSA